MIPFDITIPMSHPILNLINISTMNPKKVVRDEAMIVVMVLISPSFSADSLSIPFFLSRS